MEASNLQADFLKPSWGLPSQVHNPSATPVAGLGSFEENPSSAFGVSQCHILSVKDRNYGRLSPPKQLVDIKPQPNASGADKSKPATAVHNTELTGKMHSDRMMLINSKLSALQQQTLLSVASSKGNPPQDSVKKAASWSACAKEQASLQPAVVPGPVAVKTKGSNSQPTRLSEKCQKLGFNPIFRLFKYGKNAWGCEVNLKGTTLVTKKAHTDESTAKTAVAQQALHFMNNKPFKKRSPGVHIQGCCHENPHSQPKAHTQDLAKLQRLGREESAVRDLEHQLGYLIPKEHRKSEAEAQAFAAGLLIGMGDGRSHKATVTSPWTYRDRSPPAAERLPGLKEESRDRAGRSRERRARSRSPVRERSRADYYCLIKNTDHCSAGR